MDLCENFYVNQAKCHIISDHLETMQAICALFLPICAQVSEFVSLYDNCKINETSNKNF